MLPPAISCSAKMFVPLRANMSAKVIVSFDRTETNAPSSDPSTTSSSPNTVMLPPAWTRRSAAAISSANSETLPTAETVPFNVRVDPASRRILPASAGVLLVAVDWVAVKPATEIVWPAVISASPATSKALAKATSPPLLTVRPPPIFPLSITTSPSARISALLTCSDWGAATVSAPAILTSPPISKSTARPA